MSFKAVLFDLDGTLLDTIEDLADSMNCVLEGLGFPTHEVEPYKYFVGDGVENLVRRALPEGHRNEATVEKCAAAMNEEYGKRWGNKTRPYDGVPELLDELTARGVSKAVLTNKVQQFAQLTVAKLLSKWSFDLVAGARPSVPQKPDPTTALEIAGRLGFPPCEFLYLGDTNTDMKTAVAAGMCPVGALWGFRPVEELIASGAQVLIERPAALLDLLPESKDSLQDGGRP